MNNDTEMEIWREAWQQPSAVPEEPGNYAICRTVKRRELRLKVVRILEFAWAVFLLVFSFMVARRFQTTEMFVWALVVWILTLAASGYSIWNWRFLWLAAPKSAAEYIREYERHCLAGLRQIRFGYGFLAAGLAITIPWISWKFFLSGPAKELSSAAYLISMVLIAGLTAGYLFWFYISRKKWLRELEQLRQYKEVLIEESQLTE